MATTPLDDPRDRAFEQLYQQYVKDVYRYALAVLRNPADAEDVTQTTFMNAYRAFKDGVQVEKPQNWLIKIAHNACRTRFIRAQRRPQEVPLEDSIERLAVPESEKPNIRAILGALGRLPFNQRSALVMRELEGRSYEEIAENLGVTVPAVETLLFRARRSLRLKASSLRALGLVQLPSTLRSFWEGGGSEAVTTGGALIGGGAAFKAVAVLVAGVVAGGAGFKAVDASILKSKQPAADMHNARPLVDAVSYDFAFGGRDGALTASPAAKGGSSTAPALSKRHEGKRPVHKTGADVSQQQAAPNAAVAGGGDSSSAQAATPSQAPAPTRQARPSLPLPKLPAPSAPAAPAVPPLPSLPNPPSVPTVPLPTPPTPPTVPQPPVNIPTVPTPPLPPPPPLP